MCIINCYRNSNGFRDTYFFSVHLRSLTTFQFSVDYLSKLINSFLLVHFGKKSNNYRCAFIHIDAFMNALGIYDFF